MKETIESIRIRVVQTERDRLKEINAELVGICKAMLYEFDPAHMESPFKGQIRVWNQAQAIVTKAKAAEPHGAKET